MALPKFTNNILCYEGVDTGLLAEGCQELSSVLEMINHTFLAIGQDKNKNWTIPQSLHATGIPLAETHKEQQG